MDWRYNKGLELSIPNWCCCIKGNTESFLGTFRFLKFSEFGSTGLKSFISIYAYSHLLGRVGVVSLFAFYRVLNTRLNPTTVGGERE